MVGTQVSSHPVVATFQQLSEIWTETSSSFSLWHWWVTI